MTFSCDSQGTVVRWSPQRVRGTFGAVDLRLQVTGGTSPAYDQTIAADCELGAAVLRQGVRGRVQLLCDLGSNFAAFPGLAPDQVTSIEDAFRSTPGLRTRARDGRLNVHHSGEPAGQTPVLCSIAD